MKTDDVKHSVKVEGGIIHLITPTGNAAPCPFRTPVVIPAGQGIDGRLKLEIINSTCNSECPLFNVLITSVCSQPGQTEPDRKIGKVFLVCQKYDDPVARFDPKIIEDMP